MMDFYNQKHVRARKSHKCEFCGKEIISGETYSYESGKFDGGAADVDNIVAYCLFNPYRPERSDNHDGE